MTSAKPQLTFDKQVRIRIEENIAVQQKMLRQPVLLQTIMQVAEAMVESLRNGGKVLFFGNGGSAADAQHLAAELVGRYRCERRALPAMALTVNTSALTAVANDYSYGEVFARQIEAFGRPSDIAVGISTSGNSRNVFLGLQAANELGMISVALTGDSGGQLRKVARYTLSIPSSETPRIQESHILVGHILCELVEERFLSS